MRMSAEVREAIEVCAKIADGWAREMGRSEVPHEMGPAEACFTVAKAIRALIKQSDGW